MSAAAKFEEKLVEYGLILREYDAIEALCKEAGWSDRKLSARLDEVARRVDAVYGPLTTMLRKLAKETV